MINRLKVNSLVTLGFLIQDPYCEVHLRVLFSDLPVLSILITILDFKTFFVSMRDMAMIQTYNCERGM